MEGYHEPYNPYTEGIGLFLGCILLLTFAIFSENMASIILSILVLAGFTIHIVAKVKNKEQFIRKYLLIGLTIISIVSLWIFANYLIYLISRFLKKS
jgi:hypothetical protein